MEVKFRRRRERRPHGYLQGYPHWWLGLFLALSASGCCPLGEVVGLGACVQPGCYVPAYRGLTPGAIGCGPVPSLGNAGLDQRFGQELQLQRAFWGVGEVSVVPFYECPGVRNALSIPGGVILIGWNLTSDTIERSGTELPVAGILAHEFGHQVQFANGFVDLAQGSVRALELEADAFSGFYLGLAKSAPDRQLEAYLQVLFDAGDFEFNSPNHHGTPAERRAAGELGLQVADQGGENLSAAELHAIFTRAIDALDLADAPGPLPVGEAERIYRGLDLTRLARLLAADERR